MDDDALCDVCHITEWDTAGFVWTTRHKQRHIPPCDAALAAHERLLYLRTLAPPEDRPNYEGPLCDICEVTATDVGERWYYRHRYRKTKACRGAKDAFNKHRQATRPPPKPGGIKVVITEDALCPVCGITSSDLIGHKWYFRHRRVGINSNGPCEWANAARAKQTAQDVQAKRVANRT